MLNIDSRLIELIPTIGADAFTVLCVIGNKIGKNKNCWPTKHTLKTLTGFGRDKLNNALQVLENNKLIIIEQRLDEKTKRFKSNVYKVTTSYMSIFVNCLNEEVDDTEEDDNNNGGKEAPSTEKPSSEFPSSENQSIKYYTDSSINKLSSLSLDPHDNVTDNIEKIEQGLELTQPELSIPFTFETCKKILDSIKPENLPKYFEFINDHIKPKDFNFASNRLTWKCHAGWIKQFEVHLVTPFKKRETKPQNTYNNQSYRSNYNSKPKSAIDYEHRHPAGTYDFAPREV